MDSRRAFATLRFAELISGGKSQRYDLVNGFPASFRNVAKCRIVFRRAFATLRFAELIFGGSSQRYDLPNRFPATRRNVTNG
ncbi:MAG: hypothetical protein LBC81_04455 [Tannerellaceae bacterium]|nr:hypothetical protein [Tannerellaceae bacterium]